VEIIRAAQTTPEWKWCDESQLTTVKQAKKDLDNFKSCSEFWSAWAVQSGFFITARKNFTAEELELQLNKIPDVEKLIQTLEDEVGMVTRMATARPSKARPSTPKANKALRLER
jgi:hypothetical protein